MLRFTGLPASIELARQGFALERLNFIGAWQHTRGSSLVKIGHIGCGVVTTIRELAATAHPITGWNMPANTSNVLTDGSAGFSTAAAAALVGRGGATGLWGFCHDSPLIHVKYANAPTGDERTGWLSDTQASADALAAAILKAFDLGAKVIVITQDMRADFASLRDACATVWNGGGLIVASSGQSFITGSRLDEPRYPSVYPNVVCVGAVLQTDNAAGASGMDYFFNPSSGLADPGGVFGPRIDVAGPVRMLLSENKVDGLYGSRSDDVYRPFFPHGPPQAALSVAGVAGLVWSANVSLTNAQVRSILVSEVDRSDAGWLFDAYFPNAGIPDAERAVLRAKAIGANDGTVFPYLRIRSSDRLHQSDSYAYSSAHRNVRYRIGSDGTCEVTVRGDVGLELGGYCCVGGVEKPITNVKLILDGAVVYDGAPTSRAAGNLFQFTSHRNDYYDVRVVASADGVSPVTRTYVADYDVNPATSHTSAAYTVAPSATAIAVGSATIGLQPFAPTVAALTGTIRSIQTGVAQLGIQARAPTVTALAAAICSIQAGVAQLGVSAPPPAVRSLFNVSASEVIYLSDGTPLSIRYYDGSQWVAAQLKLPPFI